MKRLIVIPAVVAILATVILLADCHHSAPQSPLTLHLDSLMAVREQVDAPRRDSITRRLAQLARASNPVDSYGIYRDLYELYKDFNIDSATVVANSRLANARRIGQTSKCISATLNLAEAYARSGSFHEALALLDTIVPSNLADYHIAYRHSIYAKVYDGLVSNTHVPELRAEYARLRRATRDSQLLRHGDGDDVYHHIKALHLLDDGKADEALAELRKSGSDSILAANAAASHILARIYHLLGESDLEKEYLTRAAILDITKSNHDGLALMQLAELINKEGDADRAYTYLEMAYSDALAAHAYGRADQTLKSFPIIFEAHDTVERQRRHLLAWALGAIGIALLITVIAFSKVRAASARQHRLTAKLQSANEHLLQGNAKLEEANRARERFISELFDAHSDFINRMEHYRKNISRLVKVGRYKGVAELAQSNKLEQEELQSLYVRFDSMFLDMYPNFVAQINKVLQPQARIEESTRVLTPELRIVALIKIGIKGSAEIAKMLHYSVQTVYNYRFRLRNNLTISKEEFDAYIANI